MSDGMWTCAICGEHFTHAADLDMHVNSDDPVCRAVGVSRPAVDQPRVPTYRPILPPVQPQSLEVSVSDLIPPPVSPTGKPTIPQILVKASLAIVAAASYVLIQDVFPDHSIADKVAQGIVYVGTLLGIASQGVRK